jgi:hypothetical protein
MQIRIKKDIPSMNPRGMATRIPANTVLTPTWYNTFIDGIGEWFEFMHPDYLPTTVFAIHIEKIYPHQPYWNMTRTDERLTTCVNEVSTMLGLLTNPDTNLTTDMRDTALIEAYQHMQYLAQQMKAVAQQYPLPPMKEQS